MKRLKRMSRWYYLQPIIVIAYCYLSSLWAASPGKSWKHMMGGRITDFIEFDDSIYSCSWPIIYYEGEKAGYVIASFFDMSIIYSDYEHDFGVYYFSNR